MPKEGSSALSLPKEDSSKVTKIIDLQIEDFLEKINRKTVIKSPRFVMSHHELSVYVWFADENIVCVDVSDVDGNADWSSDPRSILVTGDCGNLTLEKRKDAGGAGNELYVELGSIEELKKDMTTSGNHKLDVHVTLTLMKTGKSEDDQWIIPR